MYVQNFNNLLLFRTKSASRHESHSGMSNTDNNGINSRHSKNQDTRNDRSSHRYVLKGCYKNYILNQSFL